MKEYSGLSIIIPTLNERENLEILLEILSRKYPGAHIYIADDGSTDGSAEFVNDKASSESVTPICFLDRKNNIFYTNNRDFDREKYKADLLNLRAIPGLTSSVLDTLSLIRTDKFAVIDADMQHPPDIIGEMYDRLDNADLVCAYRTKLEGFPFYRKLMTKTGTMLSNSVLPAHSRVKDPLSGAFAGNIKVLGDYLSQSEKFRPEGFKILFDLLKIIPPEVRIAATGYEFKMRSMGRSKIGYKHMWSFFSSIFDRKTKKFYTGILLMMTVITAGSVLIAFYGDIGISGKLSAFAASRPGFLKFSKFVTDTGNPFYYALFTALLAWGIIKKRKDIIRMVIIYIVVQIIASMIITGGLKILVGRPRPGHGFEHHFMTSSSRCKSFPSGHTTDAFCSAGVMWLFLRSWLLSGIFFAYSLFIGLTRVFVRSHYLLDVLAGMFIGFLTGLILMRKNSSK
ncbi:MAG: phosphatase PAP2 family protein [Elusimicrobiota bacterium]